MASDESEAKTILAYMTTSHIKIYMGECAGEYILQ